MKTVLNLSLVFLFCSLTVLQAQEPVWYEGIGYFKSSKFKKDGKVKVAIRYILGNGDAHYINVQPNSASPAKIDLRNTRVRQARLEVIFSDDFKPKWLRDNTHLVATPDCFSGGSAHLKPANKSTLVVSEDYPNRGRKLRYSIEKEGRGVLQIKFAFAEKTTFATDRENLECSSSYISIDYEIMGGYVVPEEERVWEDDEINKKDCEALQAYINQYPNSKYRSNAQNTLENIQNNYFRVCAELELEACEALLECYPPTELAEKAKKIIEIIKNPKPEVNPEEELWAKALKNNTIWSYEQYVKKYPNGKYVRDAQKFLGQLKKESETKVEKDPDILAWRAVKKNKTVESLQEYLTNYPEGKYADEAKEEISRLSDLDYKQSALDRGKFLVEVLNAKNPKFKDISFYEGMKINTDNWKFNQTLEVTLERAGVYAILVKDDWGKETVINFSDELEVSKLEKTEEGQYKGKVSGGKPPYTIRFINADNESAEASQTIEKQGDYVIDETILKQLKGTEYTLEIMDKNKSAPVPIDGKITIERTEVSNTLKMILGLSVLVVFILIAIIMGLRRVRKNRRQQAFYEK